MESNILINNLRIYAFHGVLPQERRVGGWFMISLRVHYNITRAMLTDQVADTLNYAELCELIRREMAIPSQLLEHVAGRMVRAIVERFSGVTTVELTLLKENPPMGCNSDGAGISLSMAADDLALISSNPKR